MTDHPRPASLARRALPALAVLGASGALLTQLRGTAEVGAQTLVATATGTAAGTTPSTTSPPTNSPPATTVRPGAAAGRATTSGAAGTTSPTTTAPATSTGACTGTTYTGLASTNKYGVVQVAAVVSADKKLCDVQVLSYPSNDRKSLAINQRALPTLRTQALAANGANIAGVSGATITSRGYEASLQSALDAAR